MPSLCKRPWIICASICLAVQIVINCSFADISFVTDIVTETYTCSNVANCLKNIVTERRDMTRGSIREYTGVVRGRYSVALKKEKGKILDEFTKVTGYHRKAAIRPFHRGK